MNGQDFQGICKGLLRKYEGGNLADMDVDAFADVISNVLGRSDLKADGTDYSYLSERISGDYENDIAMNPLLARMYELCRMYEMFRPRPLTEMEKKEEQIQAGIANARKYPFRISLTDGTGVLASCWWEDASGVDEIAEKVSIIAQELPDLPDLSLESNETERCGEDEFDMRLVSAFALADAGMDPLDVDNIERLGRLMGEVPMSESPGCGIVAVDAEGTERNRARGGCEARMDLRSRTALLDVYTVYGCGFRESVPEAFEGIDMSMMQELRDIDVEFAFADAEKVRDDWRDRLGDAFLIPGSTDLVGTKRPVSV